MYYGSRSALRAIWAFRKGTYQDGLVLLGDAGLLINYFGQGAVIITQGARAAENPILCTSTFQHFFTQLSPLPRSQLSLPVKH